MNCTTCGNPLPPGSASCARCGAPVAGAPQAPTTAPWTRPPGPPAPAAPPGPAAPPAPAGPPGPAPGPPGPPPGAWPPGWAPPAGQPYAAPPAGWAPPQPYGGAGYGRPTAPPPRLPGTNRYAAASLWCGLTFFLFPISIVLGIVGLVQLSQPGNPEGGKGMAIGGLSLGVLWLLITVVAFAG